jgi:hypothetical protein
VQAVSVLRLAVAGDEGSIRLSVEEGDCELDVLPLWFSLFGDSFVFLDMGPSILFFVSFFLVWVLWFIGLAY